MMKVLFTASTFSHIINFHIPYIRWYHEHGVQVHVACGGEAASIPFSDAVFRLPFEKRMYSPANFRAARMLRGRLAQEKYDLIITHTSLAAFFTRLAEAGLRDRPKTANMVHGYLFDSETPVLKRSVLLSAERWMAPQTDLLLTMNRCDYELAKRFRLGGEICCVPGVGVDYSRLDTPPDARQKLRDKLEISDDAFVIIYAAEFSKRKSQEVLIRAMELLPERAVLVLPGSGELLNDCRALASRLNLGRRVLFPGYIQDISPWYAAADAGASASRSEGLPFNILECMYIGLPVVASAVKGHTDLLRESETGLMYPYGDAERCAGALRRLMDSAKLGKSLGRSAHESAMTYSLDRVFPQVIAHYESLCPVPERKLSLKDS